jgi:hypothetical protein
MSTTLTPAEAQKLLTNLSPGTKIEISKSPAGEIVVSEINEVTKTKADILKEEYTDLVGQPITLSDASKKYNVIRRTIERWITQDYIAVINPNNYPIEIDEAEIAYCADVYHQRKGKSGVPLLDENGLPYQLKHPNLSEYRALKKKSG